MTSVRNGASSFNDDAHETPKQVGESSTAPGPEGDPSSGADGGLDPGAQTTGPTSLDANERFAIWTRLPESSEPAADNGSSEKAIPSTACRPTGEAPARVPAPNSTASDLRAWIEDKHECGSFYNTWVALDLVEIGGLLSDLQGLSKEDWDACRSALGYSLQFARQLQRIGSRLGGVIADLSDDELCRMPTGIDALEVLASLDAEQVRRLLESRDASSLTLAELVAAVQALLLGDEPAPQGESCGLSEEVDREFILHAARLQEVAARAAAAGRLDPCLAAVRRNIDQWSSDLLIPRG